MSLHAWLELIASGLITGGVYALIALGLNLQYGLMRVLNIAHGEFLMLGAFATWFAYTQLGISPLLMAPFAFAIMMGLGLVIHRLVFRRLAATSPNVDIFEARALMVCFGLMFLVQNFASWVWGGELRGYDYLTEPVHRQPHRHQHREADRDHQQRRDPQRGMRRPGEKGAQHQEFAMRDVEHPHQPVLQVEAERDQRIDAPGDETGGDQLEPGTRAHRCAAVGAGVTPSSV